MVEANAFQAIGRSWPGFWISFLRLVIITIPLSYLLTQIYNFPIIAVWGAMLLGNVVAATLGYIWIKKTMNKLDLSKAPVHK